MELSGSNIKKFHIFFYISRNERPKKIPCISRNRNLKKLLIFQEVTFQTHKIKKYASKKFLILQEMENPKKRLIFSQKEAALIFQETELSNSSLKNFQSLKIKRFLYFFL